MKRKSAAIITPSKSIKANNNIYAVKNIVMRSDDDPHVYGNFPSEYVKLGPYVYKMGNNNGAWNLMDVDNSDDYIGLTKAQYNDLNNYIFDKKITLSNFVNTVVNSSSITMTLHNDSSFRVIVKKDELSNYIHSLLNSHIVSVDQTFYVNINGTHVYATIDEIDNEKKIMGMINHDTKIEYNFTDNIIIYDKCVLIDSKSVRAVVDSCILLKSVSAMVVDNEIGSNTSVKFPLLIDKKVIDLYVRNAIGEGFNDGDTITYGHGSYEFSFTITIVGQTKQTKYKNTYKIRDSDILDVRSSTPNVVITQGLEIATKISCSCQEIATQRYDTSDYLYRASDLCKFIRDIKLLVNKQAFKYSGKNQKDINIRIKDIEPKTFETIRYKIDDNTKIVFSNDKTSNIILVRDDAPCEIKKITFKVKKIPSPGGNLLSILMGIEEEDKQILVDAKKLEKDMRKIFPKRTALGHKMKIDHKEDKLNIVVKEIIFTDETKNGKSEGKKKDKYVPLGLITKDTVFKFITSKDDKSIAINSTAMDVDNPIAELEKYVGGLSTEIKKLVRTLCIARGKLRNEFLARGLKPVKGIIFHGVPGCGKTALARNIGKIFGCDGDRFRLMSGPEVFIKWVGDSEKKVREIFKPAKEAWKKHGTNAPLYMVVIDEIDAMLPARGQSAGNTVRDSVVNQFLAEMDGLQEFNNFVCIGLTNKLDLLDPAVIRPGRFGVHIEIKLPDRKGRVEIFNIHTKKLQEINRLDNVNFDKLAELTDTFSGADIEAVTELASTYSLQRLSDLDKINDKVIEENGKVTQADFIRAINEIKTDNKLPVDKPPEHLYI